MDIAGTAFKANSYKKLTLIKKLKLLDIKFISKCLRNNLIPNFAKVKLPRTLTDVQKDKIRKSIMKNELHKHYSKLNNIEIQLLKIYNSLTKSLHFLELSQLMEQINYEIYGEVYEKSRKINNKFIQLTKTKYSSNQQQSFSNHKFFDRVVN